MSVLGFDYGNTSLLIGQASKGGIDVILNDASNRQTSTYVSILGKQRFLGDAAASMARSNVTNTISSMKLLVGRQYNDKDVQKEINRNSCKCCKLASGGVGMSIQYNNKEIVISAEHAMAMMLVKAKEISAYANASNINSTSIVPVSDVVIAVPSHYTDAQRKGILDACKIASVNCLKIANESSAIGLSYGIFKAAKKLFSDSIPTAVVFIDIGYTCYTVSIVEFLAKRMRLLATVSDRSVGGRDFDDIIVEFLIEQFQKKTKHDIRGNTKAILKLQAAAEKAKKTLSPDGVSEANVSVECVYDDIDLSVILTRDEFEKRTAPLVDKLKAPILRCFEDANIGFTNTLDIEIVGGSSRVNIVKRCISDIFNLDKKAINYGLKTTMNADEAVARGCALQCAMLSSRIKMKPFEIVERLFYGVKIVIDDNNSIPLFKRGTAYPCKPKILTLANISSSFNISIMYDDESVLLLPDGEDRLISKHSISFTNDKHGKANNDARITFDIDRNGCIIFKGAHLMVPVNDNTPNTNDSPAIDVSSKKFRKIEVDSKDIFKGLTHSELKQAIDLEAKMAVEDKIIIETAEKRNNLESYIYSMRDRLNGPLKTYCTEKEKDAVKLAFEDTEEWLYSREGEEASKAQFIEKLSSLKTIPDNVEARLKDEQARPANIRLIEKQIDLCKAFLSSLDDDDRNTLSDTIDNTEKWLQESLIKQERHGKDKDPLLTTDMINKKRDALHIIYQKFVKKPAKAQPSPPASSPPEQTSNDTSNAAKDDADIDADVGIDNMEVD